MVHVFNVVTYPRPIKLEEIIMYIHTHSNWLTGTEATIGLPQCQPRNPEGYVSPVDSPHKGQWRGALIISLICSWTYVWTNTPGVVIWTPSRSLWRHCKSSSPKPRSHTIRCEPFAAPLRCTFYASISVKGTVTNEDYLGIRGGIMPRNSPQWRQYVWL